MKRFFELVTNDPLGALVSLGTAIILMGASITAFVAIVFAIFIPGIIRERFFEETGFYVNAENIFVNILNGTIEVQNAQITSPEEYGNNKDFLFIESMRMKVDTLALAQAKFNIYRADINISELKCVRISASGFNLRDFFAELEDRVTFAPQKKFGGMTVEIDKCEYIDVSEKRINMHRQSSHKIVLTFKEPPVTREAQVYMQGVFDRADASFMSTVLKTN